MKDKLSKIEEAALLSAVEAVTEAELQQVRARYLGRKGEITAVMKGMGQLTPEERPLVGALANEVKDRLEAAFTERQEGLRQELMQQSLASEKLDVTLPGRVQRRGYKHPITQVTEEIVAIFAALGFGVVEGPEIEKDFYNFEALNIPKDHPARDMQDTFYVSEDVVLAPIHRLYRFAPCWNMSHRFVWLPQELFIAVIPILPTAQCFIRLRASW